MTDDELKTKAAELEALAERRVSEISTAVDHAVSTLASLTLGDDKQLRPMLAMVIGARLVGAGALILDELHPDAGHDMAHGIVCETIKAGGLGEFRVGVQAPGESVEEVVERQTTEHAQRGTASSKLH